MRKQLQILAAVGCLAAAEPALATEPGQGLYPNGAEGSLVANLPPPGFYAINYLRYYTADRFNDSNGNALPIDFKVNAVADFVRFLWVPPVKVLGATWAMYVVPSVAYLDVHEMGFHQSKTGLGDLLFDPLALSWHIGNVHVGGAFDIIAPTGSYRAGDLANIGNNVWDFEPFVALTWLTDHGFETSFKAMYDFYSKNDATDYQNGETFHIEYAVVQHFGRLNAGIGGYWWYQTTDDEVGGVSVGPDGNRGRAFAIGPEVGYKFHGGLINLKWQHEFGVVDRPQGENFWLRAAVRF
jgi:hypothetical protein